MLEVRKTGSGELEAIVDEDIKAFAAWFCGKLGNDPLIRSEVAILKTYLYWKLQGDKHAKTSP